MQEIRLQLAKEHEAWRGLIATLSRALGEGRVDTAVTTLDSLAQRFRRSVRDEEERILPAFEQVTGVAALSRAAAARSEHRVLLDLLGGIERAVNRGDLAVAEIDLRELNVTLELHMRKELQIVELLADQRVHLSA